VTAILALDLADDAAIDHILRTGLEEGA